MSENNVNNSQTEEMLIENAVKEPKLSFFQRMINVFVNPTKVMDDISIKPTMLVAVLLMLVVFTLLNVARLDLLKEFTMEQLELQMAQNPNAVEMPEAFIMTTVYIGLISASLVPLFVVLFKGLITHGITRLFDGKGKMKQSFSVMAFSYFIVVFGEIIRTIIGLLTGSYLVTTSLASVIPNLEFNTPLYNLLAQFDVFSIWYLIVSMIGISIVHKISKGKAAVAVFAPWGVFVAYYVVMAMIRG